MITKPSARTAALGLLSLLGLLTAGCVNLPANSEVSAVSKQTDAGGGSDVRIWPQAPQRGASQSSIVEGFLQTAASDQSNLTIARGYLTDGTDWDPVKVIVFGGDETSPTSDLKDPNQIEITGTEIATVGDDGSYQPIAQPQPHSTYTFHVKLNQAKGYYQIDQLPDGGDFGIALTQEAFRANYTAYNLYYLNSAAPGSSMITVPVYLRSEPDAVIAQNLADKLLHGPPIWLDGTAATAVSHLALVNPTSPVTIGSDGTAAIAVKNPKLCAGPGRGGCGRLADELLATFSNLASVSRVTIVDPHGTELSESANLDTVMRKYHVGPDGTGNGSYYYLGAKDEHVYSYDGKSSHLEQVGPADRRYGQLAVTLYDHQTIAAAVDDTGTKLYVGEPGIDTNAQPSWTGKISSLSWDALGHLWFIDTSHGGPQLYRIDVTRGLEARPQRVGIFGSDGGTITITRISVAPDGQRVAVGYTEPAAQAGAVVNSVGIGVLEDGIGGASLDLRQAIDYPIVSQWSTVLDIDWHGGQSLAVLGGQQPSSPSVVSELYSDGSPVINSTDLNAVTINPPNNTGSLEWNGNTLLATYGTSPQNDQIAQYSFSSNSWNPQSSMNVQGFSASYTD